MKRRHFIESTIPVILTLRFGDVQAMQSICYRPASDVDEGSVCLPQTALDENGCVVYSGFSSKDLVDGKCPATNPIILSGNAFASIAPRDFS